MDLSKLMKMKKDKMPGHEQKAKMSVLEELKKQAGDAMGGKLDGIKKVSVMAPSKEGVEKGLDKAKQLMHGMSDGGMELPEEDEHDHETAEQDPQLSGSHEMLESDSANVEECSSPEEIDEKIMKLMEMKKKMMGAE